MKVTRRLKRNWPILVFGLLLPGLLNNLPTSYRHGRSGLILSLDMASVLVMAVFTIWIDQRNPLPNKVWRDFQEQYEEKKDGIQR